MQTNSSLDLSRFVYYEKLDEEDVVDCNINWIERIALREKMRSMKLRKPERKPTIKESGKDITTPTNLQRQSTRR